MTDNTTKPLFRDIAADEDEPEITELESLCLNCEENGVTRLFLTKIPFFQDVVVSSFVCDECGYRNTELMPAGRIKDHGIRYSVNIRNKMDLNRQIVQSQYCSIKIPELDFEIPPNKGSLTTVEGVLDKTINGLLQDQPIRKISFPEEAVKIEDFIQKLEKLKEVQETFTIVLDDPSANSFIENFHAPSIDPEMKIYRYDRSEAQNEILGVTNDASTSEAETGVTKDEVLTIQSNCPNCNAPCPLNMKQVDVPNFKEVVIMAFSCEICGFRDNEVKSGSGIEDKGVKYTLHITCIEDMKRDILKSETCSISIPQLEFDTDIGTLGGKFTTVEGLLNDIRDQLGKSNPFIIGDSAKEESESRLSQFCSKIEEIINGKRLNVDLILDDPAGNSYMQNLLAPEPDPNLKVEKYIRSFEQNDELGLNDMKTENYES